MIALNAFGAKRHGTMLAVMDAIVRGLCRARAGLRVVAVDRPEMVKNSNIRCEKQHFDLMRFCALLIDLNDCIECLSRIVVSTTGKPQTRRSNDIGGKTWRSKCAICAGSAGNGSDVGASDLRI
jgi:hypothetical protein